MEQDEGGETGRKGDQAQNIEQDWSVRGASSLLNTQGVGQEGQILRKQRRWQ